ncbi:unnamed protein product, partial [marine sediment metagenome]
IAVIEGKAIINFLYHFWQNWGSGAMIKVDIF